MGFLFLLVFVGIGMVEFLTFTWIVGLFGDDMTIPIILLVADSIFGALLVKQEGRKAWQRFRQSLARGIAPSAQVVDGALILFGGTLLLTPGFLTDIVGVVCVLGPTRSVLNQMLVSRVGGAALLGRLLGAPVDAGRASGRAAGQAKKAGRSSREAHGRSSRATPTDAGPPGGGRDPSARPPTSPGKGSGDSPPPPGVIDVEVVDVKRNPSKRNPSKRNPSKRNPSERNPSERSSTERSSTKRNRAERDGGT